MPMIDVTCPAGALSPSAKQKLKHSLWAIALHWEGIEITKASASVAWFLLDERPREHFGVGGQDLSQNIYRVSVRVMVGFMDQERLEGMARDLTDAVLAADGTSGDGSGAPRVFCIIEEMPSGIWGIDGRIWTSAFAAKTLGLDDRRVTAMERAVASRPRIDVPHKIADAQVG